VYSVVGCPDCGALKVVEDRPDTTSCPRCGRRTTFEKLRRFYQGGDAETAREVRSRLLQERGDADVDVEEFAAMEEDAMAAGMSDEEFLAASGLDPEAVAAAGERADSAGSRSRREVVMDALREQDRPTREAVCEYAAEHGVDRDYAEGVLDRLRRRGEVSESGGRLRLL